MPLFTIDSGQQRSLPAAYSRMARQLEEITVVELITAYLGFAESCYLKIAYT